ncbi:hypothetical protein [Zhihengliuella halotolerans]|uniref:Ig-like domain-containing protein n=1 Tax=Zhihengliuella halotolerans TaxID=370736 RepID=A0A4Q8AA50_9MICC|nr:hypothetical protein [Zhihengliuella halotolerans]RZU60972.1 hypothetical protein EV380_0527 [Zhihengliuella halotolerans]
MKTLVMRWCASVAAASLLMGGAVVAPATAAPQPTTVAVQAPAATTTSSKLTIGTIASPVVAVGGSAKVKPSIKLSGRTELSSAKFTVKKGGKTVASKAKSASLKAGTYAVTTTATYRTYSVKDGKKTYSATKKSTKSQTLKVRTAVAIKKIASKTAPYGKKATIKPNVTVSKGAKLVSKTVTVKKGSKTLVTNKTSAALKAGKYSVTTTVKYKVPAGKSSWSKTYTTSAKQSLTIKAGAKPSRVAGTGSFNCPKGYPVKGNANSGIYHVPSGAYYSRTKPEECFTTAAAAKKAGYRASKR